MKTVIIGAGNVATHLSRALSAAGFQVCQVFSRTEKSASTLADALGCTWTVHVSEILSAASLYVFSVSDSALEELAREVYGHLMSPTSCSSHVGEGRDALFVHTSGNIPLSVLPFTHSGVFYPMQTFSRSRAVDFSEVPLFVESRTDENLLQDIAHKLSRNVTVLDSGQRARLHLAAVFANNFSNHMYHLCADILRDAGLPFSVMYPLIDETARKVHELSPHDAQTGPAVRYDRNVMNRHLNLIEDERMREIYKLLSDSIHDKL